MGDDDRNTLLDPTAELDLAVALLGGREAVARLIDTALPKPPPPALPRKGVTRGRHDTR